MRLYNGKNIRNLIDRRIKATNETRDAILWDIDPISFVCRVKIQGSNNLITAHYPRNWKSIPYWLKRGNAVSVRHRTGVRGYVEVIGEGRAIPSPVAGGSAMPTPQALADGVITGCDLTQTDPPSMNLLASSGTYRIDGVIYDFDPGTTSDAIVMDVAPIMVMGDLVGEPMDQVSYTVTLDAAPSAGYYRYDLFCVGADGVLDYLKGTIATSNPVKPTLPADHVMIGDYILVKGAATAVYNTDIGADWKTAAPTSLALSYDSTFEWDGSDDTPTRTIGVTLKDQYGNAITSSFTITLTKAYGSGQLYSLDTGWHATTVSQSIINGSAYTFTYERDQTTTEHSPVIMVTVSVGVVVQSTVYIQLLDVSGEVIN